MSLKTIFNIIYQHMKQKSISCNTSQLVISPVNAKMSSGQAFTLAWSRKDLIQGRYLRDVLWENIGLKPKSVKISLSNPNISPPHSTILLSKFFPIPAPLHTIQAVDLRIGPFTSKNKMKSLVWRRLILFSRPFLVWMSPGPIICHLRSFQLLETNSLGS